jgi:anion-transporting  ArsA/GET3 family ATPase
MTSLVRLLAKKRVIVTLGSGGVGKTTLAAALALQAAWRGRRTLVLTIDPARRLADALGLAALTTERQAVPLAGLAGPAAPGSSAGAGELWAMMLDAPRTFDALVSRHSSSEQARERIVGHRLYRTMVDALAGSHDLAAMEQLYQLTSEGLYDLVVLDTPPKEHAFDFLDAPSRLLGLVSQSRLRWLLLAMAGEGGEGSGLGTLLSLPPKLILPTLARFTGQETLRDLATLTLALLDLGTGFAERAARVEELLRGPDCSFLVVTRPDPLTVEEALGQRRKLADLRLPFGGYLVNRCQRVDPAAPPPGTDYGRLAYELAASSVAPLLPPAGRLVPLLERLGEGLALVRELAAHQAQTLAPLATDGPDPPLRLEIPEFDEEIHSLEQLRRFGGLFLGEQVEGPGG